MVPGAWRFHIARPGNGLVQQGGCNKLSELGEPREPGELHKTV